MNIQRIRKARKEDKLETLVCEIWHCTPDQAVDYFEKLEIQLKAMEKQYFWLDKVYRLSIINQSEANLNTRKVVISETPEGRIERHYEDIGLDYYNAYEFLEDYLGIGAKQAQPIKVIEAKYRNLPTGVERDGPNFILYNSIADGLLRQIH